MTMSIPDTLSFRVIIIEIEPTKQNRTDLEETISLLKRNAKFLSYIDKWKIVNFGSESGVTGVILI